MKKALTPICLLTRICILLVKVILNANKRKEIGFLHHFYCPILINKYIEKQQIVFSRQQNKLHYITKQIFLYRVCNRLIIKTFLVAPIRSTSVYFIRFSSLVYVYTQKEKKNLAFFPLFSITSFSSSPSSSSSFFSDNYQMTYDNNKTKYSVCNLDTDNY